MREDQAPTITNTGSPLGDEETHPAFGMVAVSRVSSSSGASLFDSEIRHQHFVTLKIGPATRSRHVNRDWIRAKDMPFVEVALSEAQWAALVSSFNTEGVPCTVRWTRENGEIPGIPFEPRMALSQAEVAAAADEVFANAMGALKAAEEKPTKANLRALRIAMENSAPNVKFAARSLTEHAENVVTKARADIEAMVDQRARQIGLPVEHRPVLGIEAGERSEA